MFSAPMKSAMPPEMPPEPHPPSERGLKKWLPQGLYTRSLVIVIAPIIVLQALLGYIFMERHWVSVTRKLTEATVNDIAFIIALHESLPEARLIDTAQQLRLSISFAPRDAPTAPEFTEHAPSFAPFDFPQTFLRQTLAQRIDHPASLWFEPNDKRVLIRIDLGENMLNVQAPRSRVVATNSHIFLVWMVSISVILVSVAILFLRNQLRPIKRLADAAEQFGMGRELPDFRPAGALEVRQAARAFLTMRERIKRQMEQRAILMAGISHDLRTLLTRFRLQLAMLEEGRSAMLRDIGENIAEMEHILEMYVLFVRDHRQEAPQEVVLGALLREIRRESAAPDKIRIADAEGENTRLSLPLRRNSIKRCLSNLVENADKRAARILLRVALRPRANEAGAQHAGVEAGVEIVIEDDGPGIPPAERALVFEPFQRGQDGSNREVPGSGLGLAIARDIARGHGGEVRIEDSPHLGGARVVLWLPMP